MLTQSLVEAHLRVALPGECSYHWSAPAPGENLDEYRIQSHFMLTQSLVETHLTALAQPTFGRLPLEAKSRLDAHTVPGGDASPGGIGFSGWRCRENAAITALPQSQGERFG